jgi:hypothetical protein
MPLAAIRDASGVILDRNSLTDGWHLLDYVVVKHVCSRFEDVLLYASYTMGDHLTPDFIYTPTFKQLFQNTTTPSIWL